VLYLKISSAEYLVEITCQKIEYLVEIYLWDSLIRQLLKKNILGHVSFCIRRKRADGANEYKRYPKR
jgi:hypothetical protein